MSAITVGGDLVHYEVLGRGRIVILLHSWLGSWHYWIPIMRQLQLKYRVYAVDLFGFGDSGKNPARYTINQQVYLLTDLMRQLGITKAGMIGHGLGAQVLVEFAKQQPDRVARMLLTGAPLFDPGDLSTRIPPGQQSPLTDAAALKRNQPLASKVNPHADVTVANRAPDPDATIVSSSQDTIVNPNLMINRDVLREAAMQRGLAMMRGEENNEKPDTPLPQSNGDNPLRQVLSDGLDSLLLRCFKRSDIDFEKMQTYTARTDEQVLLHSAMGFDAGSMLDSLRATSVPTVLVHGQNDLVIPAPDYPVWEYLTADKEDKLLPVPMSGVGHFPMLESEAFLRLVGSFLETPEISKIEMTERWRRRSR